jgi:NAD(P)-dependent dehydrogenase (short-subunit alcohol dehydrogenase family)
MNLVRRPLEGSIAVVTGASRGIGRALALELSKNGAHIIALSRTISGLESLDDAISDLGGTATLVPLNLKDGAGIDRLGASIYERWGLLDILVANAGILGVLSPLGHILPEVWSDVFEVNVTANWRLLRALNPLLQKSKHGRVMFMSSDCAETCTPYWGLYSSSKAALNALAQTYSQEIKTTSVCVTIVDPGPISTALRKSAMPGEDSRILKTPDVLAPFLMKFLMPEWTISGAKYSFQGEVLKEF